MYHKKEDERFFNSSELLYRALIELLQTKPLEKIRVQELSQHSTVSRATIYRNFDSLIDILYWKCSDRFHTILSNYIQAPSHLNAPDAFLVHVFREWNLDITVLEQIIRLHRTDIIYNCFQENSPIIMNALAQDFSFTETELRYFLSVRIGIFIGIVDAWITGGKRESAETIANLLVKQLHTTLKEPVYF